MLINFEDDQMVPQGRFDFVAGDCGGSVIDTQKVGLPDFDTLLSDITSTLEQTSQQDMDTTPLGEYRIEPVEQPFVLQDEITFYDEMPADIKPTTDELQKCLKQANQANSYQQLPAEHTVMTVMPVVQTDSEMDEARKEVDNVCMQLGIPADPYAWTTSEVQKWAGWTLEQYKLPCCFLDDFKIDGTSLCMLNEKEFKARSPQVGEYLYAQLEFWRNAYSLTSVPQTSTTSAPMTSSTETRTFTDLSQMTTQATVASICTQPSVMFSSTVFANSNSTRGITTVASSTTESQLPLSIPKAVFNIPTTLSPASSVDSLDSSTSSFGSSPSYVSESECQEIEMTAASGNHRNGVTPTKQNIHLWQFLRELLLQPQHYGSSIRWLDRSKGIFKIEDSAHVARLWGQRKNRPAMNYDKLSRSIRQYYKKGIIKKTDNSKRLVYQFCPQYRI